MRRFKIITAVGGVPSLWLRWTLESIAAQEWGDFNVCVVVDDAPKEKLLSEVAHEFGEKYPWHIYLRDQRMGPVRNQYDAVQRICDDPEDVVVWLDGDGDKFSHPNVLKSLNAWYSHGYDLTYGSYRPYPPSPTSQQARPWPPDVVANNSYRRAARFGGGICFNHLRTMKYKLIQQMDESDFKDKDGRWLTGAADSVFMFPGLELARGNFVFVPEILVDYHADHAGSEWKRGDNASEVTNNIVLTEKSPK
jgi:glycosyltransferase involved in cell wall biosynthesis